MISLLDFKHLIRPKSSDRFYQPNISSPFWLYSCHYNLSLTNFCCVGDEKKNRGSIEISEIANKIDGKRKGWKGLRFSYCGIVDL